MPVNDPVFLDSSGLIAILNADDQLHPYVVRVLANLRVARRVLLTTDWVIAETGNGLARTHARRRFAQAVQTFRDSPTSHVIRIEEQVFEEALQLFDQAADKTWGLVDCASFVVMRDQGILEALTADRHFEQAGFRCLLPAR